VERQTKGEYMGTRDFSIDASTFQQPALDLSETIAQKVKREGPKFPLVPRPPGYFFDDILVTLRQSKDLAGLLCWINADNGFDNGFDRTKGYALQTLQLIRALIDRLYNICALLEEPATQAPVFRKDGYRQALATLKEDRDQYGHLTDSEWPAYLQQIDKMLDESMRRDGINLNDPGSQSWPTLGAFLKTDLGKRDRGLFLSRFVKGFWNEYSSLSHGTFQALIRWAFFSIHDVAPHEQRPLIADGAERLIATHLTRAFGVIACQLTEVQAYFHFDDESKIDHRLHELWDALIVVPEVREMYEGRYRDLMEQKGIRRKLDLSTLRESLNSATST
jgi:hypothetical protein